MSITKKSIFSEVKHYKRLSQEFQAYLTKHPHSWGKYQEIFNLLVDQIYRNILEYEKNHTSQQNRQTIKLKKVFVKRYRKNFLFGDFIVHSFKKPFGYAGDFKIIDHIYQNKPYTTGFNRLWDNYFQRLDISIATRRRKEDFKEILYSQIKENKSKEIQVMNLASGPAREIKELFDAHSEISNVIFDCYDLDEQAIIYAKALLNGSKKVNFFKKNAIKLALNKDIRKEIIKEYDIIYCTGLFDYLNDKLAIKLVSNLRKLLKKEGKLIIASVGERYDNPSVCWMEWVAEWNLVYRNREEFRKIFIAAGFYQNNIEITFQDNRIMQYCLAKA